MCMILKLDNFPFSVQPNNTIGITDLFQSMDWFFSWVTLKVDIQYSSGLLWTDHSHPDRRTKMHFGNSLAMLLLLLCCCWTTNLSWEKLKITLFPYYFYVQEQEQNPKIKCPWNKIILLFLFACRFWEKSARRKKTKFDKSWKKVVAIHLVVGTFSVDYKLWKLFQYSRGKWWSLAVKIAWDRHGRKQ